MVGKCDNKWELWILPHSSSELVPLFATSADEVITAYSKINLHHRDFTKLPTVDNLHWCECARPINHV